MESALISLHELHVFDFIEKTNGWFVSKDLMDARNLAPTTARRHLRRFVKVGVLERRDAFGGPRFRWITPLDVRAQEYVNRLRAIAETFLETQISAKATFAALVNRVLGGYAVAG